MNSMTGFGKAEKKTVLGTFVVEISTVNNRYLEISPRLPRQFFSFEYKIRELLKTTLSRGKINIYVGFDESNGEGSYTINKDAATAYLKQLNSIKKQLKLGGEITINDLILLPEVTKVDMDQIDEDKAWQNLEKVIKAALTDLLKMRKSEGATLASDMTGRLKTLEKEIGKIEKRTGTAVKKYREKLYKRVNELLDKPLPDNVRIEEEIAVIAERTDISEECIRFRSHLDQYRNALKLKEPVGKKLNFILQELNREANTVASKCADVNISSSVIIIKEEIEKLREQVQNIE